MLRKAILFGALLLLSTLSVAQSSEGLLHLVDSAYSEAMAGHLPEAIHINEDGLALVPTDSIGLQCEFYSCLLFCYHRLGDYEQALHYGELCLSYDEAQGDKSNLSASLGNLAGIYSSVGKHDVAISYLNRAIRLEEEIIEDDPEHSGKSLAIRKAMLGEVLVAKSMGLPENERKELLAQALQLTKEAYQIDSELGRQAQMGMRLSQLGNIYKQIGDRDQARECNERALEIARQTGNKATEVITLLQLDRYEEAVELAQAIGMKKQEMEACRQLMLQYESEGRYKEALAMSERASELNDAMLNEEAERQLVLWQVRYDTKQKEQQLQLQEQTIQSQKTRTRWILILTILALIALMMVFLYSRLQVRRKREIETMTKAKDRYYSILSHDLKNPMVAQQLVLKMMYDGKGNQPEEEIHANLGMLLSNSNIQLEMLSNLLELTLIDQGKRLVNPIRFDLGSLITEVIDLMKIFANLKGIGIEAKVQRCMAYADRETVRTVLRNLLSNAIKFSHKDSMVEVGTRSPGSFYVRDYGVGMSKERIEEILHSTTQLKSDSGSLGENGSGIGLMLCRELLSVNQGHMEIQSEIGKGTLFTIILPEKE